MAARTETGEADHRAQGVSAGPGVSADRGVGQHENAAAGPVGGGDGRLPLTQAAGRIEIVEIVLRQQPR